MPRILANYQSRTLLLGSLMLVTILLSACGGASSSSGAGTSASVHAPAHNAASTSSSTQGGSASTPGPQYLVKTLKVGMQVKDTRKAADDLQTWINTTDPRSSSAGINYEQVSNNLYNISITFSVQATLYPQIQRYLRDYASQHGGQLLGFNESVQDVTNDYIDTQSRLKNLKGEQDRLLILQSHAQALGDILSIEQRLTEVEGQIENIEAHYKALNDQVTFYTIAITLQPADTTASPPPTPAWSPGQTFHDAFVASLAFAQALATFFIWLLAFSFYIIPAVVVVWLVMRWRAHSQRVVSPPAAPTASVTPPPVSV